jgi:hypothetical protein
MDCGSTAKRDRGRGSWRKARWWTVLAASVLTAGVTAAMPSTAHAAVVGTHGYTAAFNGVNGHLEGVSSTTWAANESGAQLAPGSSPSVAAAPNGNRMTAFTGSDNQVWVNQSLAGLNQYYHAGNGLGVTPGTDPVIAVNGQGQSQIAFNASQTHHLYLVLANNTGWDTNIEMAPDSSPAIVASRVTVPPSPDNYYDNLLNGFTIAFKGTDGALRTVDTVLPPTFGAKWTHTDPVVAGNGLGVRSGTSPSIARNADGSWRIAFQGADTRLWTVDSTGAQWQSPYAMPAGSSPSITTLATGGHQIAWAAWNAEAYHAGDDGIAHVLGNGLGLAAATSPAIAADSTGGWAVAFDGADSRLWYVDSAGTQKQTASTFATGTSPSIVFNPGTQFTGSHEYAFTGGWSVLPVSMTAGDCHQLGLDQQFTSYVGLTAPNASGTSWFFWHTWEYTDGSFAGDIWHGKWVFETASGMPVVTVTHDGPKLGAPDGGRSEIMGQYISTRISVDPALYGQITSVQWFGSC